MRIAAEAETAAEGVIGDRIINFLAKYPFVPGLIIIVFIIAGTWILIRINHAVFRRIRRFRREQQQRDQLDHPCCCRPQC